MTVFVVDDHLVRRDVVLDFASEPGFVFQADDNASLLNRGEVNVGTEGEAHIAGAVANGGAPYDASLFRNAASGEFTVVSASTDPFAVAIGYDCTGAGPDFRNDGVFDVNAQATAFGVRSTAAGADFANTFVFRVTAGEAAAGVSLEDAGQFVNTGELTADGGVSAIAVFLGWGQSLINTGLIRATSDGGEAVAVRLDAGATALVVHNSCKIVGDRALVEEAGASDAGAEVFNTRLMRGTVELGDAANALHNSGKIAGDVILGGGADLYDGGGEVKGRVDGGDGRDSLSGGAGADELDGGEGRDRLEGGAGADLLTGGGGGDVFVYGAVEQSSALAPDLIGDLQDADLIDLSGLDANAGEAGDQAFVRVAELSGEAGELAVTFGGGETLVQGDVDGDGTADLVIRLAGDQTGFIGFVL